MKTLILEADPMRARAWTAMFGGVDASVYVARSAAQARLLLLGGHFDRLCLRLGHQGGASYALLAVAHTMNPGCEIVDLATKRMRKASGPLVEAAEAAAPFMR